MGKIVHMTVLIQRKEGLSKQEFDEYWSNKHASTFLSNPVARSNLTGYSQQHIDTSLVDQVVAAFGGAMQQPEADGIVHFWARSLDDLLAVFTSQYYRDVVVPDEKNFIRTGHEKVTMGWDEEKWVDGEVGERVNVTW